MKIWITYNHASGLRSRGLGAVHIWFSKPIYYYRAYKHGEDLCPWETATMEKGLVEVGWKVVGSGNTEPAFINFGKIFGYSDNKDENLNQISTYVWKKVCEHFGFNEKNYHDEMLDSFVELEKQDKVKPEDFLLEIDLNIKMN